MKNCAELAALVGDHVLTGVDRDSTRMETWEGSERYLDCQVLNFTLGGVTYSAVEDPGDGYRSSLRHLIVSETPTKNTFAPVRVNGRMRPKGEHGAEHDVLEILDAVTRGLVLAVGTADIDDYYPIFVAEFNPGNMAINAKGAA